MATTKLALRHATGAADLAEGWLILPEFSNKGGGGTGKSVDDPALSSRVQTVMNQAHRVLRAWCAPAFAGTHFCPTAELEAFDTELDPMRLESYALNQAARIIGSDREVTIEIFPSAIDARNPRAALRVGQTIFRHLERLKTAVSAPAHEKDFLTEWRITKNLDKLVTGPQKSIVQNALRAMKAQREAFGAKGGEWNFVEIDRALRTFEPAATAFLQEP